MKIRQTSERTDITWPDGKRVAVSLTFDDARPSQLDAGIPILNGHGVRGTFYVSPGNLEPRLDEWRAAMAAGHEIGNHSLRHSCSGNFGWRNRAALEDYTLEEMEAELIEANAWLTERFGVAPVTFAYPCGQTFVGRGEERRSYVPAVARNFLAGRGFRDEYVNDPAFCDLAKLGGTEFDGTQFDSLVEVTERAASRGAWVIFVGHDVRAAAGRQVVQCEVLDRYCAWCRDPVNGVWIDTVAEIGTYLSRARAVLG